MADEAFALSPISARSASPTDADYDAIREAFLETARGRWFLGEYAKRNRNADTAMVLDAVARIEQSIAASRAPSPAPASDDTLASAKAILDKTKAVILTALTRPPLDEALSPFQRSARVIREIAWGLRESGSDVRICDMLDIQVRTITSTCEAFAGLESRDIILNAIDAAIAQIEKLAEGTPQSFANDADETMPEDGGVSYHAAKPAESALADPSPLEIKFLDTAEPPAPAMADIAPEAAPQTEETLPMASMPEVAPARIETSLGASLIARGIVTPPATATPDLLAPIRRMSQAEKIAFFS